MWFRLHLTSFQSVIPKWSKYLDPKFLKPSWKSYTEFCQGPIGTVHMLCFKRHRQMHTCRAFLSLYQWSMIIRFFYLMSSEDEDSKTTGIPLHNARSRLFTLNVPHIEMDIFTDCCLMWLVTAINPLVLWHLLSALIVLVLSLRYWLIHITKPVSAISYKPVFHRRNF